MNNALSHLGKKSKTTHEIIDINSGSHIEPNKNLEREESAKTTHAASINDTNSFAETDSMESQHPDVESENNSETSESDSDIDMYSDDLECAAPVTPGSPSPYNSTILSAIAGPIFLPMDFFTIDSNDELDIAEILVSVPLTLQNYPN